MSDRFRELEKPLDGRRLDVVLMATVSSFESLRRPTRHDLKQFSELFVPLFDAAEPETKRTAAAALSRCETVPKAVVRQIADQPIGISAPFLANAAMLSDDDIAGIVAAKGAEHARSLARRQGLSARSVAVLAGTGDPTVLRSLKLRGLVADEAAADRPADETEASRRAREENLRQTLKAMVSALRAPSRSSGAPVRVPRISAGSEARLERFALAGEPTYFATALADALATRFELVERIMLDVRGLDLADALLAIGVGPRIARAALESFYPHLGPLNGRPSAADAILAERDPAAAAARLALWLSEADEPAPRPSTHMPHVHEGRPAAAKSMNRNTGEPAAKGRKRPSLSRG